jgi:hypothetical protein
MPLRLLGLFGQSKIMKKSTNDQPAMVHSMHHQFTNND